MCGKLSLGNGLSLAVGFWVFVCSLSFTVKTPQFFLDLVTVFWGSLVCLPSSLETFSAKKAAATSGYLCAEVDQLHHLFEATMTQDFTGYKLRLRCTVSIYNIWLYIHQNNSVLIDVVYVETKWQCQDYAIVQ